MATSYNSLLGKRYETTTLIASGGEGEIYALSSPHQEKVIKVYTKNIDQLNEKDHLGRQKESVVGHFRGYLTDNKLLIDNEWVLPESIRNVRILNDEKWSNTYVFSADTKEKNGLNSTQKFPHTVCIENQEVFDTDTTWVEDYNQCAEWFD